MTEELSADSPNLITGIPAHALEVSSLLSPECFQVAARVSRLEVGWNGTQGWGCLPLMLPGAPS